MASIVEREAPRADERPTVASVLKSAPAAQHGDRRGLPAGRPDGAVCRVVGAGEWWCELPSVECVRHRSVPLQHVFQARPSASRPSQVRASRPYRRRSSRLETQYCFVATGDGGHVFATTLAEHQGQHCDLSAVGRDGRRRGLRRAGPGPDPGALLGGCVLPGNAAPVVKLGLIGALRRGRSRWATQAGRQGRRRGGQRIRTTSAPTGSFRS